MADIAKAIEKEKEYLSYRMKSEEPFHLVDAIKECGFGSLEQYFKEKAEYEFGRLTFTYNEKRPCEAIEYIFKMMDEKKTELVFVPSDETFVYSGASKPFDVEYCETNNIPVYPLYTSGGAIVSTIGDFSVVMCYPASTGADVGYLLEHFKAIFDKKMQGVEVNGNDLLLGGGKICGSVMYSQNGMSCFAGHFSFEDHSELIEKICGVSGSVKTPSVIDKMTVDEFKKAVKAWLRVL